MSDEHNPKVLGCAGHPVVETPNLDALASRGTRFTSAYTASPICVPARAAFAVGKYVHQIGYWDNADAYDGAVPGWQHVLRSRDHRAVAVGKLHFRGRPGDDHGFSEEIIPMHIVDGVGDVKGLVREDIPVRKGGEKMARYAAPGESTYTAYDREIAARAQVWLREEAPRHRDRPWVLFVSLVLPHFPLISPPHWFYRYFRDDLPLPKAYGRGERPHHPYTDEYARVSDYDTHFRDDTAVRRAVAAYYGMVSTLDENIGRIVDAVDSANLAASTRIVYTSDHGDNLGARGLWGKATFYEESAGVPLIVAGPDLPRGREVETPTDHTDFYPTILESVGASTPEAFAGHPGVSLYALLEGAHRDRVALSEYHASCSVAAAFMVRWGQWKYCHYNAYRPQLFDLAADPEEMRDLARDPAFASVLADGERRLRARLDPVEVDARAKRRQKALLASFGGRDGALARGDLGFTPAPGTRPDSD